MTRRSQILVVAATAATFALTACGSSSDDASAPETVTQIVTQTPDAAPAVDPSRAMPVLYNNWTVTSVEPAPGTTVPSDSTIILNMTKE
ncbi:hypothetical protein [Corynebacterium sp.]|uniref:hypothetical protein n=1 Tax=Corynebacterium sp. TaxID=1720 RepID=UPI003B3BE092